MTELEIGDVVELKSGGTRMTVAYAGDRYVDVIWMDNMGCKHEARFPKGILSKVSVTMEEYQRLTRAF